jgi:hypothetical protein
MFLATVTCNRDFQQLLLQAESIGKFLEPCTHVIIINEPNPDLNFYYKWLVPYYRNHNLLIYPAIELSKSYPDGNPIYSWTTQQVHKLLIAHGIYYKSDEDYVLLDSKNFFIKPTKLSDFKNMIGSGILIEEHIGAFPEANSYYADLFNTTPLKKYLSTTTPFKIQSSIIRMATTVESIKQIFLYGHDNRIKIVKASEFIFYSYLIRDKLENFKGNELARGIWTDDIHNLATVLYGTSSSNYKIFNVHRKVLFGIHPSGLDFINDWLYNDIGLMTKLYPIPEIEIYK